MFKKFFVPLLLGAVALFALAACGGDDDNYEYENGGAGEPLYLQLTLEEMGDRIEAAGTFWEDWWSLRGPFDWDYLEKAGEGPYHISWARVATNAPFQTLDDIGRYLLQYHTESSIESLGSLEVFAEHYGRLYVDITRAGFPRPNWQTASHVLLEQDRGHAVVETTILYGAWHHPAAQEDIENAIVEGFLWEMVYHFTFADGRIDSVFELPIPQSPQGDVDEIAPAHTLEEMGDIIVARGNFYEEWWQGVGRFAWENWGDESSDWIQSSNRLNYPNHPLSMAFEPLLPATGFGSINDVRNYLLNYYTESFADFQLFGEFPIFLEYDGVLYAQGARAGIVRPDWSTATHVLVEQSGPNATIDTTVHVAAWHRYPYDIGVFEDVYRFSFTNGRIDGVIRLEN